MRIFSALCLLAGLILPGAAQAQEGHPLTGTWSGDWGPNLEEREHLTVVMRWDGENVTGLINPGPRSVVLGTVRLDVTDWTVRLEAGARDDSGRSVPIAAEGRLENLESAHRTLRGTWRQGDRQGGFLLTRD
jgi:hypothetical protein